MRILLYPLRCTGAARALHLGGSNFRRMTVNDAELLAIVERWDQLPEHIRKTVSELVRLAVPAGERGQQA